MGLHRISKDYSFGTCFRDLLHILITNGKNRRGGERRGGKKREEKEGEDKEEQERGGGENISLSKGITS